MVSVKYMFIVLSADDDGEDISFLELVIGARKKLHPGCNFIRPLVLINH